MRFILILRIVNLVSFANQIHILAISIVSLRFSILDSESVVSLSVHPGSKHKVQRCFKSKDKETDFPKMTVAQLMREELKRMKMEMKQAENESNLVVIF